MTKDLHTEQLNQTITEFKTEGVEALRQRLNVIFSDVNEAINEYKMEASVWLRDVGASELLSQTKEYLQMFVSGTDFGRIALAAVHGLEVGIAWLSSEQDLHWFDVVTELVGFGICVADYLKHGHYLGDLELVAEDVIRLIHARLLSTNSPFGSLTGSN
jgi:hypothetical protein